MYGKGGVSSLCSLADNKSSVTVRDADAGGRHRIIHRHACVEMRMERHSIFILVLKKHCSAGARATETQTDDGWISFHPRSPHSAHSQILSSGRVPRGPPLVSYVPPLLYYIRSLASISSTALLSHRALSAPLATVAKCLSSRSPRQRARMRSLISTSTIIGANSAQLQPSSTPPTLDTDTPRKIY